MTAQSQLEAYLSEFRQRLKTLIVARGSAVLGITALALTLVAVYLGTRRAFDPELVIGARTVLVLALAAVVAGLLVLPLRGLRRGRGVRDIERRAPTFDGRIETYDGMAHSEARTSPFLGLLAEDSLKVAVKAPAVVKVPSREISIPAVVAVLAAGVLVWFAAFGPDNWRYGVRHLWAGWLFDNTLPPQRIAVEPGDGAVRRGGDLAIEGLAEGFDPATMEVFARFEGATDWQSATMRRAGEDAFDFTFFAVREPLRYYVSAAGVRSQEYRVSVVDLPEVRQITLTYDYPEWTSLEARVEDPGSDIRAVAGTTVTVAVHTDRPLATATLVANGEELPMQTEGSVSTATLDVDAEGEYHIATLFNQDSVKLTDDYLISLIPDEKPVVKVVKPGRDWRASNIEEVTVNVEANDDFGLDALQLRYAINGGEWQTVEIEAGSTQVSAAEILYLEDLRQPFVPARARQRSPRSIDLTQPLTLEDLRALREEFEAEVQKDAPDDASSEPEAPPPTERGLEPGDLISYYAVATDRGQSVQTDLFFVEVQPFDRSFTQGNGGAGAGGGGGQQQDEISRRQKEILVATWNLIREQDVRESFLDEQQLEDNARMLAELQRTLADQARTLANRARARQLTGVDERIQTFVENLEQAAEAMAPAAERLADLELQNAITPEQEALQHLLRAEAVFTDIQVSMQRNGGGGGGLAGRDLSELFELEMDLEKNQYETEAPVALEEEEQQQQEIDEAIAKLQELARRQEALSRQANRRNQLTEQERWEQETLRRETEELKRQLEELQQRLASQQSQQQQGEQQGEQQGQPSQGGQSAQASNGQAGGDSQSQQTAQTIEQLEQALQAMNRAGGESQIDPEQARRAIEQARRQLQQALEQMTAQRQAQAAEAFSDVADRAGELYANQREAASDLQEALQEAGADPRDRSGLRGGLDRSTAIELADRKFALQQGLEALERDIQRIAQQFRNQTPGASEELSEALTELQQSQAIARLGYAADGIRQGAGAQVAATDAVTTSALRDLEAATNEALALATREAVAGEQREPDPNAELVAEIQSLRRQLAMLTEAEAEAARGQQGQEGQQGQGQQNQQGQAGGNQPGQNQQPGGQQAGGPFGGGADDRFGFGGARGGFYDPTRDRVWDPRSSGIWQDTEAVERLRERLDIAGTDLINLGGRLRAEGLSDEELRAVRELGDALRAGLTGNPELVEAEFRALVNLAEQLELKLQQVEGAEPSTVRTEAPAQAAQGFEDIVAEYYRRLSRTRP
jgi:hypothetical protein